MEKKQTVFFRFRAGSEGAESMKKLVEAIKTCEDSAEKLAEKMGAYAYYNDSTSEFGGIGVVSFKRKPKESVFRQVDVLSQEKGGSRLQLNKLYQLNVDSEDVVMAEEETEKVLGRTDVLISIQHYTWLEIKHRLTSRAAANMCGYKLSGDKNRDDEMITMQLGGRKFRIVTFLKAKNPEALQWYKDIHRLPVLPHYTSNHYAGVPAENNQPVYFFNDNEGNFFCKASSYSSYEHDIMTEASFNELYTALNTEE